MSDAMSKNTKGAVSCSLPGTLDHGPPLHRLPSPRSPLVLATNTAARAGTISKTMPLDEFSSASRSRGRENAPLRSASALPAASKAATRLDHPQLNSSASPLKPQPLVVPQTCPLRIPLLTKPRTAAVASSKSHHVASADDGVGAPKCSFPTRTYHLTLPSDPRPLPAPYDDFGSPAARKRSAVVTSTSSLNHSHTQPSPPFKEPALIAATSAWPRSPASRVTTWTLADSFHATSRLVIGVYSTVVRRGLRARWR